VYARRGNADWLEIRCFGAIVARSCPSSFSDPCALVADLRTCDAFCVLPCWLARPHGRSAGAKSGRPKIVSHASFRLRRAFLFDGNSIPRKGASISKDVYLEPARRAQSGVDCSYLAPIQASRSRATWSDGQRKVPSAGATTSETLFLVDYKWRERAHAECASISLLRGVQLGVCHAI
jgi:hypothetical protein